MATKKTSSERWILHQMHADAERCCVIGSITAVVGVLVGGSSTACPGFRIK